jgi:hypothetical protein
VIDKLIRIIGNTDVFAFSKASLKELSTVLDFWLGGALAPTVILSTRAVVIQTIMKTIQECLSISSKDEDDHNNGVEYDYENGRGDGYDNVHCIHNIDASCYKMMKSLYDPRDTPNLRDDILKIGGGVGSIATAALVAVEIKCPSTDDQLCIREIIEDTPSMTAFSSNRSALYKTGLLFGVHVEGSITPELYSRASLIL